jgi:uncharacterized protein
MPEPLTEEELGFLRSMFDLARHGDDEQLALNIDAGVPVNLTNSTGDSLLILAAYHNHPATVRTLLDREADTARVNDRGQTALGAAVFRRSTESVTHLLAAGADPTHGPRSAVAIATVFDLPEMLALLENHDKGEEMSDHDRTHDTVSHADEPVETEPATGVGTDGSLHSAHVVEPDTVPDLEPAPGVGTDGSLHHDHVEHDR